MQYKVRHIFFKLCIQIKAPETARLIDASFHRSSLTETLAYSMLMQKPRANSLYVNSNWQQVYAFVPDRPDVLGQSLLDLTHEANTANLHRNMRIDVQVSRSLLVEEQIRDPAVGFDNFELLPIFSANPCTFVQDYAKPNYSKLLVEIVLPSYANLVDVNLEHIVNNYDTSEDFDWPFFNAIVGFASKNHIEHVKNNCKFDVNLILIEKLNQELNVKSVLPIGCRIVYETFSLPECSIELPIVDNLATEVRFGLQLTAATDQDSVCALPELDAQGVSDAENIHIILRL